MERYLFLYRQHNEDKVMLLKLPIGTSVDVETWQGLFDGFQACLLRVVTFNQLVGA